MNNPDISELSTGMKNKVKSLTVSLGHDVSAWDTRRVRLQEVVEVAGHLFHLRIVVDERQEKGFASLARWNGHDWAHVFSTDNGTATPGSLAVRKRRPGVSSFDADRRALLRLARAVSKRQ